MKINTKNKSIFNNKTYLRVFLSHSFFSFGTGFSYIIVMAKFYSVTGDAAGWAFLAAVKALPFVIFGLFVGYLIDSFNKKWMLAISNIMCAITYSLFIYTNDLLHIYMLVFIISIFTVIYEPTFRSTIPSLLDDELLLSANSLEEAMHSIVNIFGIVVSGIMLSVLGLDNCFFVCVGAYLFAAINTSLIPLSFSESDKKIDKESQFRSITKGIRTIWQVKELHYSIFLMLILTFIVGYEAPMFLPLVVSKGWGAAAMVGYMFAMVSLGALFTSFYLVRTTKSPIENKNHLAYLIFIDGTVILAVIASKQYYLSLVFCFFLGVTEVILRTYAVTKIQKVVSKDVIGRTFASISMLERPLSVFSMLLAGVMLKTFSVYIGFISSTVIEYAIAFFTLYFFFKMQKSEKIGSKTI